MSITDKIKAAVKCLAGLPMRRKIALGTAAALIAAVSLVPVLTMRGGGAADHGGGAGEAEAVMTTKVRTYDGMWDPLRYSDELYYPIGIALSGGNIIVADSMCDRIVIIEAYADHSPDRETIRVGRPGQYGLSYAQSGALVDGYRQSALFMKPSGVAVTPGGEIIAADTGNNVIRRIDSEFVITIAGGGTAGYQDGFENQAQFNAPRAVAAGEDGTIFVADTMNHCIRRIDAGGNVTLLAGVPGQAGYSDGPPAQALFHEPSGIALGADGGIFIADSGNHSIRKIADGAVTTIAGSPGDTDRVSGYPQGGYSDGENSTARFNFPRGIALLPDGGILVADTMNHAVRLIDGGHTRTLAGNGLADQYYLSAENLRLTRPEGICTDGGTVFVSDTAGNRIVAIPMTGRIMAGRPSREVMLENTGILTDSKYSYDGDIRVFIADEWLDMGRVPPWNTPDYIYVPLRPLFEALGGTVLLDDDTQVISITIDGRTTYLEKDRDYFILRGVAVSTADEIIRLFPYRFEWFPEFSLIALDVPEDLRER